MLDTSLNGIIAYMEGEHLGSSMKSEVFSLSHRNDKI